ncbi:MAG TPA: UDP-3-O-acyl-N-acetylglucosamine deacetylase [Trueperaceae bacterium]
MISGVGIHSGRTSRVRLHREPGPIRFRQGSTEIPALVEHVVSTDRCVTLAADGARVALVEHLLAALHIAGFWRDVLIEVEGEELPILDGSALPWSEALAVLGQPAPPPPPLSVEEPVDLPELEVLVTPGESSIDVIVDYAHPAIGAQRWSGRRNEWHELLAARTFGFLAELEQLNAMGLAFGAATENAIVFDDDGPIGPLRHPDEPVRHKALDLLGDLALLGRPLQAAIRVKRGSHRAHVNLMRHLLRHPTMKAAT